MQPLPFFTRAPTLAMLLAALVSAGCAGVGPTYETPTLALPEAWLAAPAETIDRSPARVARWWEQLGDPALTGLIERALAANPDLAAAQAALREARARRRLAGGDRLPTVDGSATASRSSSTGSASRNLYSAGFDASWEADLFGGIRRSIEAAEASYQSSLARLGDAQVSLAAEVALDYVSLLSFQQRLAIARANLASQSETLQFTDWRVQAGLASSLDLEQARSNRETTAAQIPNLETGLMEARYSLAILLGEAPGALGANFGETGHLPPIPDRIAVGIPADTLRQRPDVRAAERALAAETARIGIATANRYPNMRLSGSIGVEALTLGALGNAETVTRSLLAGVTGTLFDGGKLRAQVDIQKAVQEQALASYQATVLTALQEVENALLELENRRLRQEALARAADAARNAALLARQRYQSGLIDFQTVLQTERTLLSVEDSLASAAADRVSSLIQLYKALGGGWSSGAQTDMSNRSHPNRNPA